jgi:hypothetical protein
MKDVVLRLKGAMTQLSDAVDVLADVAEELERGKMAEAEKEARRANVIKMLDDIGDDDLVAEVLGVTKHTIRDEWRVKGKNRALPNPINFKRLERLHGALMKSRKRAK